MAKVEDKIKDFLDEEEPEVDADFDEDIIDQMLEFFMSLEPDQVSDEQATSIMEILDYWDDEEESDEEKELSELVRRKVRIDPAERRKRRREYRRTKFKKRRKLKKYRRSARGKLMARKSKRMAKRGRTATGKRQRTFIGARN